jgi:TRAP transporter TAXI family solute receptor
MRHRRLWLVASLALASFVALACGPATPAAQPAKPAAEQAKPAAEPAKPAAQQAKPAAEPAKPAAPAKEAERIILGTSSLQSSYGIYTAGLAKLLNQKVPGANVTLAEHGGVANNLKYAREGKVKFALGDQVLVYKAYVGDMKGYENNPFKDLRLMWVFDLLATGYVVAEDSGVKSIFDLTGKAFSPGPQGFNVQVLNDEIFPFLGIKPQLYRGATEDMLAAYRDRRIIGFVKSTPLDGRDATILDASVARPIRILSWSDDTLQKLQAKFPYLKRVEIQAGVWKGEWNEKPIATFGTSVSIWAVQDFPEEWAYKFTKAALEDRTEQVAAFPPLKGKDIGKLTVEHGLVPLHKGAIKALKEAGYQVPKELTPPEAQ